MNHTPVIEGTVEGFDEEVGLGVVSDRAGSERYPFHCTQIAGRSRTIEIGTAVTFTVAAGRHGRLEAASVTPT